MLNTSYHDLTLYRPSTILKTLAAYPEMGILCNYVQYKIAAKIDQIEKFNRTIESVRMKTKFPYEIRIKVAKLKKITKV